MKESEIVSRQYALRELKPREIPTIWPLIAEHNSGMTKTLFTRRLKAMLPLGYRVLAAFDGTRMVGISGFWLGVRFWCGRYLDVDNFIVTATHRRSGLGAQMMAWLEQKAQAERCELIGLDVYSDSFLAHRFYHRHGFVMTGYHMTKLPGTHVPFTPLRKR